MGCGLVYKVRVAGTLPEQSNFWDQLPKHWQNVVNKKDLDLIQKKIGDDFQPTSEKIFAALNLPINKVRVLIIGQDPYPNNDHAMGLAFSVPSIVKKLPPSLKNIFNELEDDLGVVRLDGNLKDWHDQGVMLLNRTLTIGKDGKSTHINLGWEIFTEKIIKRLADQGVMALLWGKEAQKFAKFFPENKIIASAHPSPLSAYRGFFGSKPFSKINQMLKDSNQRPIKW